LSLSDLVSYPVLLLLPLSLSLSLFSSFFFVLIRLPPISTLFPYTTLFRSILLIDGEVVPYCLARIPKQGETRGNLAAGGREVARSEEHTSELQSRENLVCRLLLEKKKEEQ